MIIVPLTLYCNVVQLINLYYTSVYPVFGLPQDIVTDRDVLFTSLDWKKFCTQNNISQSMSSTYHPKTDGQSEIANKSIIVTLRAKLLEQGFNWLAAILFMQVAINTSIDTSRDISCHTLCIRFSHKFEKGVVVPASPLRPDMISDALWDSVKTKLIRSRIATTQQANKCLHPSPQYQVGDLLKISSTCHPKETQFNKLELVFMGPYKIFHYMPETDNHIFEISFTPAGFIIVHTCLLVP